MKLFFVYLYKLICLSIPSQAKPIKKEIYNLTGLLLNIFDLISYSANFIH